MFQGLSEGRSDLGLYHVALQSDRRYGVDRDKCNEHDNNRRWKYQRQRRRRRGGVIIVVVGRGGIPRKMG